MKTSVPKLHSIKNKNGTKHKNIHELGVNPYVKSRCDRLCVAIQDAIDENAIGMTYAEIMGVLYYIIEDNK